MMKQGHVQTDYIFSLMLEHVGLVRLCAQSVFITVPLCPPARKNFGKALKKWKSAAKDSLAANQEWDAGAGSRRQVVLQNTTGVSSCLALVPLLRPALFSCYHQFTTK